MEAVQFRSPTVLTPAAIEMISPEPLGNIQGVAHRVLWADGSSIAGVLTVAGGMRLGAHTHRVNEHHIWVLAGGAEILGTHVAPGSYVHIPSGVEHDIDARSSHGCSVFYLYVRPADRLPEGGSAPGPIGSPIT